MSNFLKCKLPSCASPLKAPDLARAEKDYRYEELKGWCPEHGDQELMLDEQDEMIAQLRRSARESSCLTP
jgi:hypothetical protein